MSNPTELTENVSLASVSTKNNSVPKQKFRSFPVVIKEDFVLRLHLFQI